MLAGVLLVLAGCDNKHVVVEESAARFAPVITRIEQGKALSIHSLLVWQAERLILEVYREGGGLDGSYQTANVPVGKDAIHNVHSVTKSFVATLIFIAIDEGRIESLDTPVLDFFPEYQGADRQQKMAITIRDVMNMSASYALDELSTPYGEGNIFSRHYNAKDLQKLFLTTDLAFVPGSRFAYSGLSTIGLSKIIESVYGKSFNQVMKTKLFEPLGISDYQWLPQLGSGEAGVDWGLRIIHREIWENLA
ncbi:serine hydrolase [Vibrio sp. CAU 1672]|uniref:serine hydrolase domain-containing protein n=1 Tax=Vibrio sp. CAU 1672 TaxID=3032594 RepID=UPI0023DC1641|nr:serine hydrolase [Vibrio sp. CAU 1672]MDF2153664.1 serine hydrolase [Vibrio sp. CAU 1672]